MIYFKTFPHFLTIGMACVLVNACSSNNSDQTPPPDQSNSALENNSSSSPKPDAPVVVGENDFLPPSDAPKESVENIECSDGKCLKIDSNTKFCSLYPTPLTEGHIFTTHSTLQFQKGSYLVGDGKNLNKLSVTLKSGTGEYTLHPADRGSYSIKPKMVNNLGELTSPERLLFNGSLKNDDLNIDKFYFLAPAWPYEHFRLGNAEDTYWFYEAGRSVSLNTGEGTGIFPGLKNIAIDYAPCELRSQDDDLFKFTFQDGSVAELTARSINGSNGIGFYTGRLVAAKGTISGREFDVTVPEQLAFFGSTRSWSKMAIPTLALNVGKEEGTDICGFIFDSSQWDMLEAVDGYRVYEMTCDERFGKEVPLKSVERPGKYILP